MLSAESGELRRPEVSLSEEVTHGLVLTADLAPRQEDEPCSGFIPPGTQSFDSPNGFSRTLVSSDLIIKGSHVMSIYGSSVVWGEEGSQPCEFHGLM